MLANESVERPEIIILDADEVGAFITDGDWDSPEWEVLDPYEVLGVDPTPWGDVIVGVREHPDAEPSHWIASHGDSILGTFPPQEQALAAWWHRQRAMLEWEDRVG